jgi:hypothetical protein
MPHEFQVTEPDPVLYYFNERAARDVAVALADGRKVTRIESSFNDTGEDYVEFRVDGEVIAHIKGY